MKHNKREWGAVPVSKIATLLESYFIFLAKEQNGKNLSQQSIATINRVIFSHKPANMFLSSALPTTSSPTWTPASLLDSSSVLPTTPTTANTPTTHDSSAHSPNISQDSSKTRQQQL
jgi:hypothetical protein